MSTPNSLPQLPDFPVRPAPDPDRLAEVHADQAYKQGKWLTWAVAGGQPETLEAEALLSGEYDDRALDDASLDGTVLAQDKQLFDQSPLSIVQQLRGQTTPGLELRQLLAKRHEFYTSPAVRERARLLSNEPIEVDRDPANVLWYFTGDRILGPDQQEVKGLVEIPETYLTFHVPDGKRLIIDNIPKGDPQDRYPYTDANPLSRSQVQVYHNSEGYLVADKIMGGAIRKKQEISLLPSDDPNVVEIDLDSPRRPALESLRPHNGRKQEFFDPLYPDIRTISLINTTASWRLPTGAHSELEITVFTEDDAKNSIEVILETNQHLPEEYGPIAMRLVDDTSDGLAHFMYQ